MITGAVYNEIDSFAADWLENLINAKHIAQGTVRRESVRDLSPDSVAGSGQRHFFAGIGAWSRALRLAGVADDADVWTGSCPCQPFSPAGRGRGFSDDRHLWPAWFELIRECRPAVIFGEQVAGGAGLAWFDLVRADLDGAGYAVGGANLCAAGFGAPHLRQRLYWVAYAHGVEGRLHVPRRRSLDEVPEALGGGEAGRGVAHADGAGPQGFPGAGGAGQRLPRPDSDDRWLGDADGEAAGRDDRGLPRAQGSARPGDGGSIDHGPRDAGGDRRLGDAEVLRPERGEDVRREEGDRSQLAGGTLHGGPTTGFWDPCDWVRCADPSRGEIWRPVEPGTFPLAHGATGRVGRLRAYGNAINAEQAAAFIVAALDAIEGTRGAA